MKINLFIQIILSIFLSLILTIKTIHQNFHVYTNSDLLYSILLSKDILEYNLNWDITPSSYLFPDVFLVLFLTKLFSSYSILFFIYFHFVSITLFYIFYRITENSLYSFYILNLLICIFSLVPDSISLFFFPTYHSSAFLFSLFFILKKDRIYSWLLFPFFLFSDKILITILIIPYLYTYRKELNKIIILKLSSVFLITKSIELLFIKYEIFHFINIPILSVLKSNLKNFNLFEYFLYAKNLFLNEIYFIDFIFFILLILFYILINIRLKLDSRLIQFLFLSILFNLLVQIFFKIYSGYRYNWFLYLFSFICISVLMKSIMEIKILKLLIIIVPFLFSLYQLNLITQFEKDIYPKSIQCLDSLSDKYKFKNGISDYWNSKYIRAFTKKNISITQKDSELRPYRWISNRNWEMNSDFNFIIPQRLNPNKVMELWGKPDRIEECNSLPIWIYFTEKSLP